MRTTATITNGGSFLTRLRQAAAATGARGDEDPRNRRLREIKGHGRLLQLVDLLLAGAAGCGPAGRLSFAGLRPRLVPGEWGEHGKGALEQFHVQANLVFQRTERAAQRLGEVLTELLPPRPNAGSVPTTRLTADFALLESLSQLVIVGFLGP